MVRSNPRYALAPAAGFGVRAAGLSSTAEKFSGAVRPSVEVNFCSPESSFLDVIIRFYILREEDLACRRRENCAGIITKMAEQEIIKVDKLVRRYGDFAAVDGISFGVKRGEIFAFLGPNGAGKTTTIKMLTTVLQPTEGKMELDGHDPVRDKMGARRSFGIVFQDPSLDDDLTAYENLNFHAVLYKIPAALRKQRVKEILEFVGLWERRNDLVKTYSGGMKRRLEIGRGFLHHPAILFLDEPTLGLDPQTRNHVWGYLNDTNRKEGMTIFFTTHYMEDAERVANRIAIIDHGKIIAIGTSAELKERTSAETLEDAFLALTGHSIRKEEASSVDAMRNMRRMFRGGGRR